MKTALTVAGFDPSSGAGTSRDLDTFFSLRVHGLSIPSCFVIQGPHGVTSVHPVSPEVIKGQIHALTDHEVPDAIKIGVLLDGAILSFIRPVIENKPSIPVILDPVMKAKNGVPLMIPDGLEALKAFMPLITILTPNTDEAAVLCERPVRTVNEMKECADALLNKGLKAVVVKGGHLEGNPIDLFFDGTTFIEWERRRIRSRAIHGTGCTFSSLLTAYMALGYPMNEAFTASEKRMDELLHGAYDLSSGGYAYISSAARDHLAAERWRVAQALTDTMVRLSLLNPVEFVPQVRMNMAFALEGAQGIDDVAAFPGRVGCHEGRLCFHGRPEFGASSYVATSILAVMGIHPWLRAGAALRHEQATIEKARSMGLAVSPLPGHPGQDGGNRDDLDRLKDRIHQVLASAPEPQDIIYDTGSQGREPIIHLFGRDPHEVINKMEMIRS